jgi:hypothetical protein
MTRCPMCGRPVVQPWTGRKRVYCSQAHRQAAYEDRHPFGEEFLRAAGIPDYRPLQMLAQKGIDVSLWR